MKDKECTSTCIGNKKYNYFEGIIKVCEPIELVNEEEK